MSSQKSSGLLGSGVNEGATLLPPLNNELVFTQIWPRFHQSLNISLLWRLRRVNRAWREGVGKTLEWATLDMVPVDTPNFVWYLSKHHERRPSLQDRVESKVKSFKLLFAERLADLENRSKTRRTKGEEDENSWQLSSSTNSGEKHDRWNRSSRRQLC